MCVRVCTLACSHVSLVSGTPRFTKSLLSQLYANSHLSTAQAWPGSGLHGLQEGTLVFPVLGPQGLANNAVLHAHFEMGYFLVPPRGSHLRYLKRLL